MVINGCERVRVRTTIGRVRNLFALPYVLAACLPGHGFAAQDDAETDTSAISMGVSIEVEHEREHLVLPGEADDETSEQTTGTVQFEFEAVSTTESGARIVLELDTDDESDSVVDEAFLFMESDAFAAMAGRVYVPFGRYDSLFATDSFTEFGEIRATSVVFEIHPTTNLEAGLFFFDGRIDAGNANDLDYGAGLEWSPPDASWRLGGGYVSDLAEARDPAFDISGRRVARRVAGWNFFAGMTLGKFEWFLESVAADGRLAGQDPAFDEPAAGTVEVIYRPHERLDLAARVEASREIADTPRRRYGVSARWYASEHLGIGIDFLSGRFKGNGASDDEDDAPSRAREILLQLVLDP